MTDITIDQTQCHVCNTHYRKYTVAKKHVYATCHQCERQDEVGMVF